MAELRKPLEFGGIVRVNFSELEKNKYYFVYPNQFAPSDSPVPNPTGIFKVLRDSTNDYWTEELQLADGAVYVRTYGFGTYYPWQRIDNFGYNSLAELSAGVAGNISVTHVSKTINGITIDTYNYGNIVTVILSGTATTNFSYADIYDVGLVKTAKRIRHNISGTSGYITTRNEGHYFNINGIKEGESIGSSIDGFVSFTYVRG